MPTTATSPRTTRPQTASPANHNYPLNNHRPTGYSTITPTFQSSNMFPRTITYSRSNTQVRSFLNPNTGTPASSPRKVSGYRGVTGGTRPLTAPMGGSGKEIVDSGATSPLRGQLQRPKTPRRNTGPIVIPVVRQQAVKSQAPQCTPRPRTTISTLLPPRKMSSLSSTSVADGDSNLMESDMTPVKIKSLHFGSSYTPHKCHWVKKALETLGVEWLKEGKITREFLVGEEFEEKMSVLYDLAMARKHEAIDRLVTEEIEMANGKGAAAGGFRKKKAAAGRKDNKDKSKGSSGGEVQGNFPFAQHITGQVKESMSEALLRIMMRSDEKKVASDGSANTKKKGKRDTSTPKKSCSPKKEKDDTSASSNSFERSLMKRKLQVCYVIDGKLTRATQDRMLSVGGSFVNKFGESSQSRARRNPSSLKKTVYFRQTSNMMGFHNSEVSIRYCKNSRQLIVSGARPKRGSDNARQVREIIEIPKDINIFSGLLVLRTSRGSLIFEEVEEDGGGQQEFGKSGGGDGGKNN